MSARSLTNSADFRPQMTSLAIPLRGRIGGEHSGAAPAELLAISLGGGGKWGGYRYVNEGKSTGKLRAADDSSWLRYSERTLRQFWLHSAPLYVLM